jgi:hypothetical protein
MARFSYNSTNETNRIIQLTLWRAAPAACQLTPCPRTSLSAGAGLWGAAPALPVMKTPLTVIATLNSSSISAVNSL